MKDFPSEPQNRTETKDISYHLQNLKVDCVIYYIPNLLLLNVEEDRKAGQKQRRKEEKIIIKKETAEEKKKNKRRRETEESRIKERHILLFTCARLTLFRSN